MNLRELSTADVDKIRDAVTALSGDLALLDGLRSRRSEMAADWYAPKEAKILAWVESSARALAAVLA
jgi:hypothetical protein